MARHQLEEGRHAISWLGELGRALGYEPEEEWEIRDPLGSTYADLAWLRRKDDEVPIFLFEVESRSGSQLAENAAKILGVPTAEVAKPLFFFHLVLRGGGGRPGRAGREYAASNYSIYELNQVGAADRLLADIFTQATRIERAVDPMAVWKALQGSPLKLHVEAAFDELEKRMTADWTRAYAILAIEHLGVRERLFRRLLPVADGEELLDGRYETYWEQWREPLHLGLIARAFPPHGERAFARLRSWQEATTLTTIGPHFGLDRDYDTFVLFGAGLLWTLTAALFDQVGEAPQWIARQLAATLEVGGMRFEAVVNSATWLLYLSVAFREQGAFDVAARHLARYGGLPPTYSRNMPFFGIGPDDSHGWEQFSAALGTERKTASRDLILDFLNCHSAKALSPETAALILLTQGGAEQRVSDGLLGHLSKRSHRPVAEPNLFSA
jgi:hypothetical protein